MRAGEAVEPGSWCTTVLLGGRPVSDVADLADALAAASDALHEADPDEMATSERQRRRPRIRHDGHVASIVGLGDRVLHLSPVAAPALGSLLAGGPVRVGDLRDLDDESQLVLARRLVREGLLTVTPPRT